MSLSKLFVLLLYVPQRMCHDYLEDDAAATQCLIDHRDEPTIGAKCRSIIVRQAQAQANDINLNPEVRFYDAIVCIFDCTDFVACIHMARRSTVRATLTKGSSVKALLPAKGAFTSASKSISMSCPQHAEMRSSKC